MNAVLQELEFCPVFLSALCVRLRTENSVGHILCKRDLKEEIVHQPPLIHHTQLRSLTLYGDALILSPNTTCRMNTADYPHSSTYTSPPPRPFCLSFTCPKFSTGSLSLLASALSSTWQKSKLDKHTKYNVKTTHQQLCYRTSHAPPPLSTPLHHPPPLSTTLLHMPHLVNS